MVNGPEKFLMCMFTGSILCPGFILYFLEISDTSSISLAFGVARVVYMATTGRSMVSSTKTLPTSICNDRKSFFCFTFSFIFLLSQMSVFSGIQFRMNQAFTVLSDSVIHCICLGFVTIPPKDTLIHFESEH